MHYGRGKVDVGCKSVQTDVITLGRQCHEKLVTI